jgi:hypothetical protein
MLSRQGETGPGHIPIPLTIVMYEDEIRKEDKRILLGAAYLVYLYGREVSICTWWKVRAREKIFRRNHWIYV